VWPIIVTVITNMKDCSSSEVVVYDEEWAMSGKPCKIETWFLNTINIK